MDRDIGSMVTNLVIPLLVAAAVYLYLPRPESTLLVILEAKPCNLKLEQIEAIGNIKQAFQIIQTADGHMQQVDVASKLNYNYVFMSTDMAKKEEEMKFRETINQLEFVNKLEIFPYQSNPVRLMLLNLFIKIKGIIFDSSLTKSDRSDDEFETLCTGNLGKDAGAKVMVNIIKQNENAKEALEKYNNMVVFGLFPKIGSFILDAGKVDSDYWSMVVLMHYESVAAACQMVSSQEFQGVHKYKVEGLLDTHTYFTKQIL